MYFARYFLSLFSFPPVFPQNLCLIYNYLGLYVDSCAFTLSLPSCHCSLCVICSPVFSSHLLYWFLNVLDFGLCLVDCPFGLFAFANRFPLLQFMRKTFDWMDFSQHLISPGFEIVSFSVEPVCRSLSQKLKGFSFAGGPVLSLRSVSDVFKRSCADLHLLWLISTSPPHIFTSIKLNFPFNVGRESGGSLPFHYSVTDGDLLNW